MSTEVADETLQRWFVKNKNTHKKWKRVWINFSQIYFYYGRAFITFNYHTSFERLQLVGVESRRWSASSACALRYEMAGVNGEAAVVRDS